jgi:hypothetical protein
VCECKSRGVFAIRMKQDETRHDETGEKKKAGFFSLVPLLLLLLLPPLLLALLCRLAVPEAGR